MKKIIIFIILICIITTLSSCNNRPYKYLYDTAEIKSITIVELIDIDQNTYEFIQKDISVIEQLDVFLEKIATLDCHYNNFIFGDPSQLEIGDTVIKIAYNNGDYELIGPFTQVIRKTSSNHDGFQVFEKDQFEELISDFIDETDDTQ